MTLASLTRPAAAPLEAASRMAGEAWSAREPQLTGWAIASLLTLLRGTWAVERFALDVAGARRPVAEPVRNPSVRRLYVLWHCDAIVAAATHMLLAPAVLASHHRDGERVSGALRRLGYPVVRGSTRRGGARAIFSLSHLARSGHDLAVTPDGPLGPAGHVGRGVVEVARRAGLEIVPVGFGISRAWTFATWDRTRLPWPGARIHIVYGPTVDVGRDCLSVEAVRGEVEAGLARAQTAAREAAASR